MFWRRKENSARPVVKKVSELIDTKSHAQRKYISLMIVPSYSTGKTRSLRIPRVVLHGALIAIFLICSVVTGFYINSRYNQRIAQTLSDSLEETMEAFYAYRYESEQVQSELIDATVQMYEQLSEEQQRARTEMARQERRHQDTLGDIWEIIDELEEQILEFEEERQEIISNLTSNNVIPPIAGLLSDMQEAQDSLLATRPCREPAQPHGPALPTFGLLGFGSSQALCEDTVVERLDFLVGELEMQRRLMESLEVYKEKMEPYLLNFPTIWPLRGEISSGFGWRSNPFGSGREFHHGIDIPARTGTPIRAAGGGTVLTSGWANGYGYIVIIDHGSGITTKYAHNSLNLVTTGARVERGDIIAHVGSTGRSTGPHLHYEVRRNGNRINPVGFLLEIF